jgi:hypothetical protein
VAAQGDGERVNIFLPIAVRHLKKTRYAGEKCQRDPPVFGCTRHDIYVKLESAKRSATGSGVSRHVGPDRRDGLAPETPVIVRADNALSRLSLTPFQSENRPLPLLFRPFRAVFFCYVCPVCFSVSSHLAAARHLRGLRDLHREGRGSRALPVQVYM